MCNAISQPQTANDSQLGFAQQKTARHNFRERFFNVTTVLCQNELYLSLRYSDYLPKSKIQLPDHRVVLFGLAKFVENESPRPIFILNHCSSCQGHPQCPARELVSGMLTAFVKQLSPSMVILTERLRNSRSKRRLSCMGLAFAISPQLCHGS